MENGRDSYRGNHRDSISRGIDFSQIERLAHRFTRFANRSNEGEAALLDEERQQITIGCE